LSTATSFFYPPFGVVVPHLAQETASLVQRDLRWAFALQQKSTLWSY
jgi:hypothetical protein